MCCKNSKSWDTDNNYIMCPENGKVLPIIAVRHPKDADRAA